MKRMIKNSIYAFIIMAILVMAASVWNPAVDRFKVEGNTIIERMHSLAGVLTNNSDSFADVFFVDYDDKVKAWVFTVQVKRSRDDIYDRSPNQPNLLLKKYSQVMKDIFVETSKMAPDKGGRIKIFAVFSDSKAEEWSTQSMALLSENPNEWTNFVINQNVLQIPKSEFDEIMKNLRQFSR